MKALAVILSMIAVAYAQPLPEQPSTCASVSCIALAGVSCKEVLNTNTGIIQGQCINNYVPTGNEQVCKEGQPLLVAGANGATEASCGRSSNRITCPSGYSCNIHPADAYAVCCPDGGPEMCTEPPQVGPCKAIIPRYFFNTTSKQCQHFSWGGCEPNFNNFLSLEECEVNCIKSGDKPGQCPAAKPGDVGICGFTCQQDGECSGVQKCCPTACGGTSCTLPASTTPLSCDNTQCGKGQYCKMQEVTCIRAPCLPIPTCIETATRCSPTCGKGYECQLQRPWYCYRSCEPRPTCVRSRTCPTYPARVNPNCVRRDRCSPSNPLSCSSGSGTICCATDCGNRCVQPK